MEEDIKNNSIYAKLNVIRLELSKKMEKSGKNDYSHYDYFQLKDFIPQTIALCNDQGILTLFWVGKEKLDLPTKKVTEEKFDDNGVLIGKITTEEDNFTYIEYGYLRAIDLESGEEILLKKETRECQVTGAQAIQNLGSKSTYMKRYLYMDLLEINENDKIEEMTGAPVKAESKPVTKVSKPKVSTVKTTVETPVQQDITPYNISEVNTKPAEITPVEINTEEITPVEINTEELMSMETKMSLANYIKTVGLDPRTTIVEVAKELGTDVPQLKECQKDKILEIVNKKVGK